MSNLPTDAVSTLREFLSRTQNLASAVDLARRPAVPQDSVTKLAQLIASAPGNKELERLRDTVRSLQSTCSIEDLNRARGLVSGLIGSHGAVGRYAAPASGAIDAILTQPNNKLMMMEAKRSSSPPSSDKASAIKSTGDLGALVRSRRRAMKLSQQRFADMAGVGRRFLSELEGGKPSLEIGRVLAVCAAAGIDLQAVVR